MNSQEAAQNCAEVVDGGLLKYLKIAEDIAEMEAENVVRKWCDRPMNWNTHRACNRKFGKWTTYRGEEIDWNESL